MPQIREISWGGLELIATGPGLVRRRRNPYFRRTKYF